MAATKRGEKEVFGCFYELKGRVLLGVWPPKEGKKKFLVAFTS